MRGRRRTRLEGVIAALIAEQGAVLDMLELTPDGEAWTPALDEGYGAIGHAVRALREAERLASPPEALRVEVAEVERIGRGLGYKARLMINGEFEALALEEGCGGALALLWWAGPECPAARAFYAWSRGHPAVDQGCEFEQREAAAIVIGGMVDEWEASCS